MWLHSDAREISHLRVLRRRGCRVWNWGIGCIELDRSLSTGDAWILRPGEQLLGQINALLSSSLWWTILRASVLPRNTNCKICIPGQIFCFRKEYRLVRGRRLNDLCRGKRYGLEVRIIGVDWTLFGSLLPGSPHVLKISELGAFAWLPFRRWRGGQNSLTRF
jgi:hypothetical protein